MRTRVEVICKDCGEKISGRIHVRKDATCFTCKYKAKKPKHTPPARAND